MKTKLLFICLGNICRSPAAESVMKSLVTHQNCADLYEIDSAGIGDWHVGQLPDHRMRSCGAKRGYDFSSHARQFTPKDFDRFDYIIVMDYMNYNDITHQARTDTDKNKVICLADYLEHHPGQQTIPDPYYGDEKNFEFALDLIEDGCIGLLAKLQCPNT
jgi:protein-tyrosine phosphatase